MLLQVRAGVRVRIRVRDMVRISNRIRGGELINYSLLTSLSLALTGVIRITDR